MKKQIALILLAPLALLGQDQETPLDQLARPPHHEPDAGFRSPPPMGPFGHPPSAPFSEKYIDRLLMVIKQKNPEQYETLIRLREEQPEEFRRKMAALFQEGIRNRMRERNPEEFNRMKRMRSEADPNAQEFGSRYKKFNQNNARGEGLDTLMQQLSPQGQAVARENLKRLLESLPPEDRDKVIQRFQLDPSNFKNQPGDQNLDMMRNLCQPERVNPEIDKMERETRDMARDYRQVQDNGKRENIKGALRQKLCNLFDMHEQKRAEELRKLETNLKELRQLLGKRREHRDKIIEHRLMQLLKEDDYTR